MTSPKLLFHHVGIASHSIEYEKNYYISLGYMNETETFLDPLQKIKCVFMTLGPMRIELLEPTSKDSPLNSFLLRGISMYHQAFECRSLLEAIPYFVNEGALLTVAPLPAVAFNGRKIAFLMLRNKLLIELIESALI